MHKLGNTAEVMRKPKKYILAINIRHTRTFLKTNMILVPFNNNAVKTSLSITIAKALLIKNCYLHSIISTFLYSLPYILLPFDMLCFTQCKYEYPKSITKNTESKGKFK